MSTPDVPCLHPEIPGDIPTRQPRSYDTTLLCFSNFILFLISTINNPMRKSNSFAFMQNVFFWTVLALLLNVGIQPSAQAQCSMACNDLVQFSLGLNCADPVLPDHILEAPQSCPGEKEVLVMGPNGQPILGSPLVTGAYIGQTLTVKVTHIGTGNACWGSILVKDKLPPNLVCRDTTLWCSVTNYGPQVIGYPEVSDNCEEYGDPVLHWSDHFTKLDCGNGNAAQVNRVWTATDASGNSSVCTQQIFFQQATIGDVVWPLNLDDLSAPALLCPNPNTHPGVTGWPTVGGQPVGGFCDLSASYQDQTTSMCQGSQTIFRTWTVHDMCNGVITTHTQIIKVVDKQGPTLICPTDPEHQIVVLDYLAGPNHPTCMAVVKFPQIQIQDNCSSYTNLTFSIKTVINGFVYSIPTNGGIMTLPLGTHTFEYKATDNCGNSNVCTFQFTVVDKVPPVVACETLHTVALSTDVTHVHAHTFDDGSYDDCGAITFQASRLDNPKCPEKNGTPFGPTVPFYCCDIGTGPIMVTLRVTDAAGNWNECMTLVEVVDKVPPSIWCPPSIEVQCGTDHAPTAPSAYVKEVKPNVNISSAFAFVYQVPIEVQGLPADAQILDLNVFLDIKHEWVDQLRISLISPAGTKVSLFDGNACGILGENILVTFNDQGDPFTCGPNNPAISGNRRPLGDLLSFFNGEGLNSIPTGPNTKNDWVLVVEDTAPLAGGRIDEVRLIFTWGTGLALRPKVHDNTELCGIDLTWNDLDDPTACSGEYIRRVWTAEDASGNLRSCTQYIYFYDDTPWEVEFPADITLDECTDLNDLNNLGNIKHNGDCEMVAVSMMDKVLTVVPDACYKIERTWIVVDWCKYDKLNPSNTKLGIPVGTRTWRDDGDGYFEYVQVIKVLDKEAPKIFCPNDVTVLNMEPDCGPTFVQLDTVVWLDCSPTMQFTISIDLNNNGSIDQIKNGTVNASGVFPNGTHRIHYRVEDGCGNSSTCSFLLTVVDGKKPQVSCRNINVELMAMNGGGMAQITASMINLNSEDNCTAPYKLLMSVEPNVFTCDDLGLNDVTLSVTDEAGNTDICIAIVDVQDNMNVCPGGGGAGGTIVGLVKDLNKDAIENVEVTVVGLPAHNMMTGSAGSFMFSNLPTGVGYVVEAKKDFDHLNGISTYDLLLIQKHILGVKMFNSPLKMIAADVNNSNNITISDIIDLRKCLLTASAFTKNTSWRFIDSDYQFSNPSNPFGEGWPEFTSVKTLTKTGANVKFTGIKIGDVSGDAVPNSLLGAEVRLEEGTLTFTTPDVRIDAGAEHRMEVRARDMAHMEGFQFTLGFDKSQLAFAGIEPVALPGLGLTNFGTSFVDEGYITASWNGQIEELDENAVLFAVNFRALQPVQLREAVTLGSVYLRAEAYDKMDNYLAAELRFAGESGQLSSGEEFVLHQNRPNPFRDETIIGFELPHAGPATLVLTDMSGRTLRMYRGEFGRGYNEFRILRSDLQATGVVYYRLTADGYAATRKMVIID